MGEKIEKKKTIIQNIFSFNLISTVAVSNVLVQINYLDDRRNSLCCNFKSQFQLIKKMNKKFNRDHQRYREKVLRFIRAN